MFQLLRGFAAEEDGQDLIEYSLLITFIAIACMAFVSSGRPGVTNIWTRANTRLGNATVSANGG